jgi:hypothetical protein
MHTRPKRRITVVTLAMVLASASGCQEQARDAASSEMRVTAASVQTDAGGASAGGTTAASNAQLALDAASRSGRYLFVFIWRDADDKTQAMRRVFQGFVGGIADRANSVEICVTAAEEKGFVDTYGLARAPMPLVLAFASNQAITGAFPTDFSEDDLSGGFASPRTADVMKLLQDGKLVMLCVQNAGTQANDDAIAGAKEFSRDERYQAATEFVMLDPTDPAEAGFLKDLQISPDTSVAVTVLLAPPGSPVAKFEGATTKDLFVEALSKASSECCPGGQCGPEDKGPAT